VAAAVLPVLLLVLRGLRLFRVLALPVLLGVTLVVGWLLVDSSLTISRFTTAGPVVKNGVAVIVACGKKQGMWGIDEALRYADEPRTGPWDPVQQGECTAGTTIRRVGNSVMRATSGRIKLVTNRGDPHGK